MYGKIYSEKVVLIKIGQSSDLKKLVYKFTFKNYGYWSLERGFEKFVC